MPSTFLVTASDEFEATARDELRQYDPRLKPGTSPAPGLFEVISSLGESDFGALLAQDHPIYARHIFPVQATLSLTKTETDLENLAALVGNLPRLAELNAETPFAIQVRLLEAEEGKALTYPYTPFAVKERLAKIISDKTGATENIKAPQEILSVVAVGEQAYLGLSPAELNLSSWPGGMRRFSKRPEQISRAELKLEEALEVFETELPKGGLALDLGAAPGGWTRLLLEAGLKVTAIDPADLDPRLRDLPGLTHHRGYAENFLKSALHDKSKLGKYAVIASDLRMDAAQAANLIVEYAPLLARDGLVFTTLKLPHESVKLKPARIVEDAIRILRGAYSQIQARQLFHNRQEITVYLRK